MSDKSKSGKAKKELGKIECAECETVVAKFDPEENPQIDEHTDMQLLCVPCADKVEKG